MRGSVVIRRCAGVEEAVVVCGLLRSGGFDASMENWFHATAAPHAIQALGGVAVRVPESQLHAAGLFMIDHCRDAEHILSEHFPGEHFDPAPRRYWLARSFVFLVTGGPYILCVLGLASFMILPANLLNTQTLQWRSSRFMADATISDWILEVAIASSSLLIFIAITSMFARMARRFLDKRHPRTSEIQ